jgi:hypothetical protein
MDGSGRWCDEDSTYNTGVWTGTFDFCDLSGGTVDWNTGSIAGTITNCTTPCNVGINDIASATRETVAYPNPFENQTTIRLSEGDFSAWDELSFTLFDQTGKAVQVDWTLDSNEIKIDGTTMASGMYFYQIKDSGAQQSSGILIAR